jgi:rhodanese-related sulfurtransferase
MGINQAEPQQAHETLTKNPGAVYLDVRTEGEFAQGHPAQMEVNPDFVAVAEKVLPKGTKLVVGCMAGGRSQRACEMLEDAGYADLTNVTGGFGGARDGSGQIVVPGWRDAGLPVTTELGDASYQEQRKKAGL